MPEEVLHRAKIVAAQRRTTLKSLFLTGLEMALQSNSDAPSREAALNRLRLGLKLGAQPLTHNQAHERH